MVVLESQISLEATACVGGSASPFIEEGDGFTSKREKVRWLLSLVAYAIGYKKMVGTCNTVDVTVERQMHVGGRAAFFRTSRCRHLQKYCSMPGGM